MTYEFGQNLYVNVRDFPYNARGDGIVHSPDESVAIQNAINTVSAAGGGVVYIPAGTYVFNTPSNPSHTFIIPKSNVTVMGAGDASIIQVAPGLAAPPGFNVFSTGISGGPQVINAKFMNFCIDGNSANNPNTGNLNNFLIMVQDGYGITIQNCLIVNANSLNPILLGDPTSANINMLDVNISNNRFENIANDTNLTDHATVWFSGDGAVIHGNIFTSPVTNITAESVGTAVELHGQNIVCSSNKIEVYANCFNVGSGALTRNVSIVNNVADRVHAFVELFENSAGTPVGFPDGYTNSVKIANNMVGLQDRGNFGLEAIFVGFFGDSTMSFDQIEITGNTFRVDFPPPSVSSTILGIAGNLTNLLIANNTLIGPARFGITVSPSAYLSGQNFSSDIIIKNNKILNCGDTASYGIYIVTFAAETTHRRYVIEDNVITDNRAVPVMLNGINLIGAVNGISFNRNIITGFTNRAINIGGGSAFTNVAPLITSGSGVPILDATYGAFEGSTYQRTDSPNGALYVLRGGVWTEAGVGGVNVTTVTTSYLVLSTDDVVAVGVISSPITITLPASPVTGQELTIKDSAASASAHTITISGNGNNIDGNTSVLITSNYGTYGLVFNGTSWSVM